MSGETRRFVNDLVEAVFDVTGEHSCYALGEVANSKRLCNILDGVGVVDSTHRVMGQRAILIWTGMRRFPPRGVFWREEVRIAGHPWRATLTSRSLRGTPRAHELNLRPLLCASVRYTSEGRR